MWADMKSDWQCILESAFDFSVKYVALTNLA